MDLKMLHMKSLQDIRSKYLLTQQQLADWLGVSRPLITLAEKGARSLPTAAFIKLAEMEKSYHAALQQKKQLTDAKLEAGIRQQKVLKAKRVKNRAEICRLNAGMMKYKLNKLVKEHESAKTCMKAISILLAGQSTGKKESGQKIWLGIRELEMRKRLMRSGEHMQAMLQHKIDLFLSEAHIHERLERRLNS